MICDTRRLVLVATLALFGILMPLFGGWRRPHVYQDRPPATATHTRLFMNEEEDHQEEKKGSKHGQEGEAEER